MPSRWGGILAHLFLDKLSSRACCGFRGSCCGQPKRRPRWWHRRDMSGDLAKPADRMRTRSSSSPGTSRRLSVFALRMHEPAVRSCRPCLHVH